MREQLSAEHEGSVSCGTMREEDLIPCFESVLDGADVDYSGNRPECVDALLEGEELTDKEREEVGYYLNETLFDLMNDIAPPNCYFGSHPGDGCDYGFWREDEDTED